MAWIQGVVEAVRVNEGKFGPMCTVVVSGTNYGTKKDSCGMRQGDTVKFQATQNVKGYWDVDRSTVSAVEPAAGTSQPVTKSSPPTTNYPNSFDSRQDHIEWQSARNAAIPFVALCHAVGKIDFGKAKGADSVAILETWVDKFTEHFFAENKALKASPSQGAKPAAVAIDENAFVDDEQLPF